MARTDPKVTFRLPPEQHEQLKAVMPWRMQDALFQRFVEALIDAYDANGADALLDVAEGRAGIYIQ